MATSSYDFPGFQHRRLNDVTPAEWTASGNKALGVQIGGDHYKNVKIQPVEYTHANGIPFIEGCIIKYATRWRDKGGIQDLKKIIHFTELLIQLEEKK